MRNLILKFRREEKGAAFLEYTVLLAILLAGSIATVSLVGGKASQWWTALNTSFTAP